MKRFSLACLLALGACSQNVSEREIRNRQRREQSSVKRQELETVAGTYEGKLTNSGGFDQLVTLKLEVREVQEASSESVDPVLVPKILGNLRFRFGDEGGREYIDAPVVESEYLPTENFIHLVVKHDQFDRMTLKLDVQESARVLTGTWSASTVGASGTVWVTRMGGAR